MSDITSAQGHASRSIRVLFLVSAFAFFACMFGPTRVQAQTTEFTYQGSLKDGVNPANGNYDFEFLLFDSLGGPTQIGSTLTRSPVAVSAGVFSVKLDFGGQFPGANRFLEVHVRQSGGGGFTTLSPRNQILSAPYAVQSINSTGLGGRPKEGFVQNGTTTQPFTDFNISGNGILGGNLTANGVVGNNSGSSGAGVKGQQGNGSGFVTGASGVWGDSNSGFGVYGTSNTNFGVGGASNSGYGVYGISSMGYAGYFFGNVYVTGTLTQNSDARLKRDVSKLSYGLREVLRLRPVSWTWKEKSNGSANLGLIAQEVEPIIPELVSTGKDGEQTKGMNYIGLISVLVKGMQEQQTQIDTQRKQIESLTKIVCELNSKADICRR